MGANSKIEWTDHTFNPWWGCAKVAAGCTNCYAESQSKRYGHAVWGKDAPRRFMSDAHWRQPLKWNRDARNSRVDWEGRDPNMQRATIADLGIETVHRRPRVFCGSMCDVFEDRPDLTGPRRRLFYLIRDTPELDWLLLTKRPENVLRIAPLWEELSNVWLGTSIACQADADRNVPLLLRVPARVRFLSVEPLVGPVELRPSLHLSKTNRVCWTCGFATNRQDEPLCPNCGTASMEADRRPDWVIVGGESGGKARPCDVEWIRSIVRQCRDAGVPCFVKQLGANVLCPQDEPISTAEHATIEIRSHVGPDGLLLRDRKGGDSSEWPEDLRVRELPQVAA